MISFATPVIRRVRPRAGRLASAGVPAALVAAALLVGAPPPARADTEQDRFSAAGYFRVMARPDLEGGLSRLGLWNLSGRLLNEGPYAALELKLDVLQPTPGTSDVWASVHAKLEGGGLQGAEPTNGSLAGFRLSQLYVRAGNLLLDDVTWQLGTLHTYFGDLGLYDLRPTDLFFETIGVSATYHHPRFDWLVGGGDSGYLVRGPSYSTVLTAGTSVRVRLARGLEAGAGGEVFYEPEVRGNRNAPYDTPLPAGITYEDYFRREVTERYEELFPGQLDAFPKPTPTSSTSYKLIGYLGFGPVGPLRWNNLFASLVRRFPEGSYVESLGGRDFSIYVRGLTDERYHLTIGDEAQLRLVPGRLDAVLAGLVGYRWDEDNEIAATEDDEVYASAVLRLQTYLSPTLHTLVESSLAREVSLQGNLWRGHFDSVFQSTGGLADADGLEFGDLDTRDTWQLKAGLVLNPLGHGIFTRPSLRLLYGLQWSSMHNAFGNSFVETLDEYDVFQETADRNWHQVIALEAEAWF